MKINPNIFRAYDIRGIFPRDVNEEIAYRIGRAFVQFLPSRKRKLNIVVGQDNRISSPLLKKRLVQGITDSGANVIDIGLSTTPMLYFATAHHKFDGGIEISASHNPSNYNGFKLIREKAIPVSEKTGLRDIKKLVLEGKFKKGRKGRIIEKEIMEDYLKFILKNINLKKIKLLKVVIDTANGIVGILIPEVSKRIPCKVYHLFPKLDGNFPNHPPDPLVKTNLKKLQLEIKKKKADLGVAFDGDGDRIIFVDEKEKVIPADLIYALIVDLVLRTKSRQKILYDLRSSNVVREVILKRKGIPIMGRVGHSFIKERMRKENILLAGELSGHYYLRDRYFFESPFFILFKLLEKISESKEGISEIIKGYQKYFHSGEINFGVKNKKKKIKDLEKYFRKGKVSHLDGLRIDFSNWWFNVRPSNTEPLLRLVIEAKSKKLLQDKKKEIIKIIKE